MPQKSSRRNAANQHDKRHETGLAAPGKRIHKQRSTQNLNGSANGNGKPTASTPPLPSVDVDQHMTLPTTPNGSAHGKSVDVDMAPKAVAKPVTGTRERFPSDASLDAPDNFTFDHVNGTMDASFGTPRRGDANGSVNSTSAYKGNLITLATTILSSCPLQDVIAILIILLQIGPLSLTIVHALFSVLTFVPPSSPTSISTLPSLTDMFHGSGGTPSVTLIMFIDVVTLLAWLVFGVRLQNLVLDLAQAVIAISLGGAASGKGGTTHSMIICMLIIGTSNLGHCGYFRQYLRYYTQNSHKWILAYLDSPALGPEVTPASCSTSYGWIRSALGLHILAQGFLRFVRRYLSRRDQAQAIVTKKADTETAASTQARKNSNGVESTQEPPATSSTDGRPPGPSPASREVKEKSISTKKKRRQATHVRSQQPLWAAIASTKVTVLKEMEQNQAANDAEEANATDPQHIGNAKFQKAYEDRVWISNITSSAVSFGASLFQLSAEPQDNTDGCPGECSQPTKPFYVRVNGTVWRSTRIREISTNQLVDEGMMSICKGEIFGLTPFSNYNVDFVRTLDDAVLCTTSLITPPDPSAELASATSPAAPKTLRPSSPATTLKNSIAGADAILQEQRNRLKRSRKEHRNHLSTLRSDLDKSTNRLSGAGGSDDRQQSKLLQFKRELAQTEEAITELENELLSQGDIPEEEHDAYYAQKKSWRAEKDSEASVVEDLNRCTADSDRNTASIQSDIASALQKRERLVARQAKLHIEQDRLKKMAADAQKYKAQRAEQLKQRAIQEQEYLNAVDQMNQTIAQTQQRNAELEGQTTHLETIFQQNSQQTSNPGTPEAHSALNNSIRGVHGMPFQSFNGYPNVPGSIYYQQTRRGRSSSMLSGVSGFTDDLDDPMDSMNPYEHARAPVTWPGPYIWGSNNVDRKGSSGSGSGSSGSTGSGSGSQRDPLSPIPQSATEASFPKGSMSPQGAER